MKTLELTLKSFDELTSDQQQQVLEKYRSREVENDDWYESTLAYWGEKLRAEYGIDCFDEERVAGSGGRIFIQKAPQIRFSGFSSQGDGCMFEGSLENAPRFFTRLNEEYTSLSEDVLTSLEQNQVHVYWDVTHVGHYCHSYCSERYLSVENLSETWNYTEFQETVFAALEGHILEQEAGITAWYHAICNQIYRELEAEYESLQTDEYLAERFREENLHFDEDFDIYD